MRRNYGCGYMKFRYFLVIFVLACQSSFILAQNTPQEEALQLFQEGHYAEALPIYKRLITLFPKDPRYQYYEGVCLVQINTSLARAIEYLKFASDKAVPRDVYFFLGKANHYLYRFDEALDNYLKFQQFGERAEKDKWQCDMHINMARNGKRLIERQVTVDVHMVDSVKPEELFSFYNRLVKGGKFQEKSEKSFLGEAKSKTWRFVPSFLDNGQGVYESASGSFKKNRDLVVVKKLENDNWSRPENLGTVVNSSFDEDYAYFSMAESALYFASKGHNSMGGYDIFKSVFNPNTKTWSEPVNLGFPINSPYDDFLFVPSDDQSQVWFASNRDTHGDKIMIYTIGFSREYASSSLLSNADFVSIAHLTSSASKASQSKQQSVAEYKPKSKLKTVSQQTITKKPEPVEKPSSTSAYPTELIEHKEYNALLNSALQYQLQSDSLSRIAEDNRQALQNAKTDGEKNKLKHDMYALEQRSKTAQQKADELYAKAREYELSYSGKSKPGNSSRQVTDDMVKNAFANSEGKSASKPERKKDKTEKVVKESKPIAKPVVYEFKILSKAPYKSVSDIPVNQPLPDGLLYRIQMGAFSKVIEPDRFKGITPISGETVQNGAITKYYAGMFSRMDDAEKALNKIREYGFKDAYVVSFFNGKTVPINRAKELEKDN